MPFSPKTLDFLVENRMNDSKLWFNEHKADFEKYVKIPFKEFTDKLTGYINEIDPDIDKIHIARIYRDTRFSKGKSIYRENMWVSFSRAKDLYKSLPAFYFDISAQGFEYGCGYYCASTEMMEAMRTLIKNDTPVYAAAQEAFDSQDIFELYGDMYKRNRFPEESEVKCQWLNRKTIGLTALSKDWDMLFSDKLAEKVGNDLKSIAPVYDLFMKAGEMVMKDNQS